MKFRMLFLIAASLMLGANLSYGYAVTVANASFENPTAPTATGGGWTVNTNGAYNTTVEDWTAGGEGAYGTWKPNNKFDPMPDGGSQVAYFYTDTVASPRSISQQLTGETLTAGYTYTLSANVGARNDTGSFTFGGGKIELLANGVPIGEAVKTTASWVGGDWYLVQLTVSADAQNPLLLNLPLSIRLSKATAGATHSSFADVSLTAVPLPAAAWLFGSALLGLGWTKRFRRQPQDALIA